MDPLDISLPSSTRQDRGFPYPDTPPSLPQDHSARTERSIRDYGNQAREDFAIRHSALENSGTQSELVLGADGSFEDDTGHRQSLDDTNGLSLEEGSMIERLNDALISIEIKETKFFLPRQDLLAICNFHAVFAELKEHEHFRDDPSATRACAEYICGPLSNPKTSAKSSAREIFATLVLIKEIGLISGFMRRNIVDDNLPLQSNKGHKKLWTRGSSEQEHLDFFDAKQSKGSTREFFYKQWWLHVPSIIQDPTARDYKLATGTVLPLSHVESAGEGAHGKVYKVRVHNSHHNFGMAYGNKDRTFALKIFNGPPPRAKKLFEKELKAFKKNMKWKHVVDLCATFEVGDECMFLLPWAGGGSLCDLMKSSDCPPTLDPSSSKQDLVEFTQWIHEQCAGLIKGLHCIHEWLDNAPKDDLGRLDRKEYGVHSDIKPANILHFVDEGSLSRFGTLKLADFGLLKYHSRETRTQEVKYPGPPNQIYMAPEYEFSRILSRKVDIWALGCVFSEFLTWAVKGNASVENFCDKRFEELRKDAKGRVRSWQDEGFFTRSPRTRTFFSTSVFGTTDKNNLYEEPKLKRSVSEWIEELRTLASCGQPKTFLQDFLDTIRDEMLAIDREKRIECAKMDQFFEECKRKGQSQEDYWLFPPGVIPEERDDTVFDSIEQMMDIESRSASLNPSDDENLHVKSREEGYYYTWTTPMIFIGCLSILYASSRWLKPATTATIKVA